MYTNLYTDSCTDNTVRLNNRVVEVCHDAQWGLVCEHLNSYYTPAAEVVCRQVGVPSRSQFVVFLSCVQNLHAQIPEP